MDFEQALSLSGELGSWLNGMNPVIPLGGGSQTEAGEVFSKALEKQGLLGKMDDDYWTGKPSCRILFCSGSVWMAASGRALF